jgi:putative acetyltransferase
MRLDHPLPAVDAYALRAATNQDQPAIWALISSVLHSYGITTDAATTDADLVDIDAFYSGGKGAFFVLLDGPEIVGTVALHRETDAVCELCRMYLGAAYRGRGLGRRLLAHALGEARQRGFREIFLKTASVLTAAISLYRQAGFETAPGAKVGGNCDLVMRRMLDWPTRTRRDTTCLPRDKFAT